MSSLGSGSSELAGKLERNARSGANQKKISKKQITKKSLDSFVKRVHNNFSLHFNNSFNSSAAAPSNQSAAFVPSGRAIGTEGNVQQQYQVLSAKNLRLKRSEPSRESEEEYFSRRKGSEYTEQEVPVAARRRLQQCEEQLALLQREAEARDRASRVTKQRNI